MPNEQLLNYVKQQLQKGASPEQVKQALLESGWKQEVIDEAINEVYPSIKKNLAPGGSSNSKGVAFSPLTGSFSLLANSFRFFLENIGILLIASIVPVLASLMLSLREDAFAMGVSVFRGGSFLVVYLILTLGFVYLQALGMTVLIEVIKKVHDNKNINIVSEYKLQARKALSYWFIAILFAFVVGFGFLAFIIPGIIFGVWYMFAPYVLVDEGVKGSASFGRSKELVKGRFLSVFGRVFVGFSVVFAAFIALSISGLVAASLYAMPRYYLGTLVPPIYFILLLGILPFITTYFFKLYTDLKQTIHKV